MANIKFSAFTQKVAQTDVDFLVGYTGADNVRISPSTIGQGVYLPLSGGTMTGDLRLNDNVELELGSGADIRMYHNDSNGYINSFKGDLYIRAFDDDKDIIFQSDNGSGGVTAYLTLDGSTTNAYFSNPGNVGIGTTSPGAKLEVVGSGTAAIFGDGTRAFKVYTDADEVSLLAEGSVPMKFYTSGAEKMRIDTAGNIGIGTTSPDHNLQVENSGNAEIQAQRTSGAGVLIQAQSAAGVVGTNTNHRLDLKTNSTTRATISTGGNVGIGTTSPNFPLDVKSATIDTVANFESGDASVAVNFVASDNSMQIATSGTDGLLKNNGAGSLRFFNNGSERVRITSAGNVGIGTTSPVPKLHVYQNDAEVDTMAGVTIEQNGTGDSALSFLLTGVKRWRLGIDNNDGDKFKISDSTNLSASNRFTIDTSGNIGIGETNIDARLHITTASSGLVNQKFESAASAAWRLGIPASQTYFAFDNANDNLSAPKVVIDSSGNVGIGTTSPASKLEVDGGDVEVSDSLNGLILKSPDGTRYRVTVANGGTLTVSAV